MLVLKFQLSGQFKHNEVCSDAVARDVANNLDLVCYLFGNVDRQQHHQ
jgi:hypothetical protein